jgi:hypothetical protein
MPARSEVGVAALASIVAILVTAAAACGPSASSSEPPSSSAAATTIRPTAGTATTSIPATGGTSTACVEASRAFAALGPRVLMTYASGAAPASDAELDADVAQFRAIVPDEVKADADTYVRTLLAFVAALSSATSPPGHGSTVLDRTAVDDADRLLLDPVFVTATAHLEHYFRTTCGPP